MKRDEAERGEVELIVSKVKAEELIDGLRNIISSADGQEADCNLNTVNGTIRAYKSIADDNIIFIRMWADE